ncbi:OmpA family protein [Myxococcota bacterium]|nr:OmpA family protein [Myxococcota bacterium]MBU1900514.1 OmpA family protein [Myxococcota bacterium]
MRSFLCLPLLLNLALAAGPAWRHQAKTNVPPGQQAELILSPTNTVYDVLLVLETEGMKKTFRAKKIKAGAQKRFAWKPPKGVSEWRGRLTGSADGATTTAEINLRIVSVGPLEVRISPKDVDLVGGQILAHPSRPLSKVELIAFGDQGAKIVDEEATLEVTPTGTIFKFDVPEGAAVRMIQMKMHDEHGFWSAINIAAWYIEVEHEEVQFESGSAEIRAEERPKLDHAIERIEGELKQLNRQLEAYSKALKQKIKVEQRLFVAGHTDTVGQPADNRALSLKRARSIATYFKGKLNIPIYYEGFGEAALAVPTGDNVDEPRNRRALYVLSNAAPSGQGFPQAGWKKL